MDHTEPEIDDEGHNQTQRRLDEMPDTDKPAALPSVPGNEPDAEEEPIDELRTEPN